VDDGGANVALGIVNDARVLGPLTCGLILVAPGAAYPEHAHPPQEIYLPISGRGSWRYGGSGEYRSLHDDSLVYNHPRDLHGTIAGDEPLLALYILWA
jgi:quercetin dioxygenase-like cupin family protein